MSIYFLFVWLQIGWSLVYLGCAQQGQSAPPMSHPSWANNYLRFVLLMVKDRSVGGQAWNM